MIWFWAFVMLVATLPGTINLSKKIALASLLRREGVQIQGFITGKTQYKSTTTYRVQFTTLSGVSFEEYSKSSHEFYGTLDFVQGDEVTLHYQVTEPSNFMLDKELSQTGTWVILVGVIAIPLSLFAGALYVQLRTIT